MSGFGLVLLSSVSLASGGLRMPSPPPPLCPLQAGVCAGSRYGQLPDGTIALKCTPSDYGPNYEEHESRCDGMDNDCDGKTDQWWTPLTVLESPHGNWPLTYTTIPGGFVIATVNAAGIPFLRYRDLQGLQIRPDVTFNDWNAGFVRSFSLARTANGILLVIASRYVAATYWSPLDSDGLPLHALQAIPLPFPAGFVRSGASSDGSRVLHLLTGDGAVDYPTQILGLTQDAAGNVIAGPAVVMNKAHDGQDRFIALRPVGTAPDRFVMAALEDTNHSPAPAYLRALPLSDSLQPTGPERTIQTFSDLGATLLPPSPTGEVPMFYQDREIVTSTDSTVFVRLVPDVLAPVPDTSQVWLQATAWQISTTVAASDQGPRLAWAALQYTSETNTYHWGVRASGASGQRNLDPASGELLSPGTPVNQPFAVGISHARPDAWTVLVSYTPMAGPSELDAVTWCAP